MSTTVKEIKAIIEPILLDYGFSGQVILFGSNVKPDANKVSEGSIKLGLNILKNKFNDPDAGIEMSDKIRQAFAPCKVEFTGTSTYEKGTMIQTHKDLKERLDKGIVIYGA